MPATAQRIRQSGRVAVMTKGERRERKRRKSRYGMKVSGTSVKLIEQQLGKRASNA